MNIEEKRENPKETTYPPEVGEQQCPRCQAMIPVHAGYPTWCHQCDWNLDLRKPPQHQRLFEKLYRSISQRSSQRLFEEMVRGRSLAATLTPAKALAFLLAGCVHSITIAFVALGIWLGLFAFPAARFLGLFLGLGCFLMAWLLLPSLPKAPTSVLPRERFPTLYRITDRIARALGSPAVDGILYDLQFNAAFARFGWRQKRLLMLGLPLFAILDGQEKVALLGHELAHAVNGDPTRGMFLSAATYSLARWHDLLHPQDSWGGGTSSGSVSDSLRLVRLVTWPLVAGIWLVSYALSHLVWYDIQRAEYLADFLAAEAGGTDAMLAMLDKLHLQGFFQQCLRVAYLRRKDQDFFAELSRQVARVPSREIERIRRIEMRTYASIDTSHPPTAYRREFLEAHYIAKARVELSPAELTQLDQELSPLLRWAQEQILDLDELSFQERFGPY